MASMASETYAASAQESGNLLDLAAAGVQVFGSEVREDGICTGHEVSV